MKTYKEFIAEAKKRISFTSVYRGDAPNISKEIKRNRNVRSSEYGVYGPGVYASSDKNVARHYSGIKNSDEGVTKSRILKRSYKTVRTPEHNHPEGIQKSREVIFGGNKKSVRIKGAASEQERRSHAPNKVKGTSSDYFVVNPDTFNKGITKQPTIRAKGKPQRTKTQPKRK
jgi:hypothetical protein